MNNKHHFSVLLASRPAGRLLHINSADRRVCFMYYNKTSFILASHCIFLRHLAFNVLPILCSSQLCVCWETFRAKKGGNKKRKKQLFKLYRQGLPTSVRLRGFRPRHRPHVDNPREGDMYQRLRGEVDSYKFYLLTKLPLFIR